MEQRFIAASHKDSAVIKQSSSGGAFTAVSDEWFSKYGDKAVVYGCAFTENLNAAHIRATTLADRDKMRGSKYVLSDMTGVYDSVFDDLQNGLYVLFSGTPCQIASLNAFLENKKISAEGLLTVDLICNGVASNKFFEDYILNLENKYKGKAVYLNFRGKERKGATTMEVDFDNGKKYRAGSTRYDWFYSLYYKNYVINSGCFNCKFARVERCADITLADMKCKNGQVDAKYKSLIIVNTEKGMTISDLVLQKMEWAETALSDLDQPRLYGPAEKPNDYDAFWQIYNQKGYLAAQKYAGNNTAFAKLRVLAVSLLNFLGLTNVLKKIKG